MATEFRKDLVSGKWVLFSTDRAKRIQDNKPKEVFYQPPTGCPFEDPVKSGNELVWSYPEGSDWKIMVVKNKFPAVQEGICGPGEQIGPFQTYQGTGQHDVFIFRDHDKKITDFSLEEMTETLAIYKRRHQELSAVGECSQYVLLFHNSGPEAGASLYHPHSQIISLPIFPPDVYRSLHGAYLFFEEKRKNVYDLMIEWEMEQKKRIILENTNFIAFCPFVSHSPYEVRIYPQNRQSDFEKMPVELEKDLAEILLGVLKKVRVGLGDPGFNFFIHSVPVKEMLGEGGITMNINQFYTWHIEIMPKISISAGFEMGTDIDVNIVDPDEAAELLINS